MSYSNQDVHPPELLSIEPENQEVNPAANTHIPVSTHLQKFMTTVAGAASIVTLSGYIVLHSYLRAYTDIPIVGILPQFYIVAGINLAVFVSILLIYIWIGAHLGNWGGWLTTKPIEKAPSLKIKRWIALVLLIILIIAGGKIIYDYPSIIRISALFFAPFGILILVYAVEICKGKGVDSHIQKIFQFVRQPSLIFIHISHSLITLSAFFLYIGFYVFFLGGTYGSVGYATLPSAIGGGKSATVQLVFRDNHDMARLNIAINNDMQSESLCLLSITDSQYVLYHPHDKRIVIVPFDIVLTLFDSDQQLNCAP